MVYRFSKLSFLASYPPKLIMCVRFIRVYLHRSLETGFCFLTLPSLLIDQSEIVMSRRVRRIQRCSLQVPLEIFTRSLRADHFAKQISQYKDEKDQKKRRR